MLLPRSTGLPHLYFSAALENTISVHSHLVNLQSLKKCGPLMIVLCTQPTEETLEHLFLKCDFAQACWLSLNLSVDTEVEPFVTLECFKQQLGVPFYMEIIILMSWSIWVARNDHTFQGILPSISNCWVFFKKEFALVIHRAKKKYFPFYRRMARAPIVIFCIFFVSFFVS